MRQAMFAAAMATLLGTGGSPQARAESDPAADEGLEALLVAQAEPEPKAELEVISLPQDEAAPTPTPRPKRSHPQLEEIIVTAQRREESL